MKKIISIFSLIFICSFVFSQSARSPMDRKKERVRDYLFSNYIIADLKSDSIRVLSYLSIPNHSLQFLKKNNEFSADYEATITLKNDNGELVGRKNWSNKIKTNTYLESVSRNISTLHFFEFKILPGNYKISSELLDRDSNDSEIKLKEIEVKEKSKLKLFSLFLIDDLEGFWGLEPNEIPLFNNTFPEKSNNVTLFLSGNVLPGKFNVDIAITTPSRDKIWEESLSLSSDNNSFFQKVVIPKDIAFKGLRKMITVSVTQGKEKNKKSIIFASKRAGISNSIGSMDQAIASMRYILQDQEWKTFKKASKEERELIFLDYWSEKDPTPKTKENELQNEYFKRVEFANSNFKGYKEGWDSQMGMIYILFGRPDDVEEYNDPIGRYYQQRWHYYKVNKYFDFVDENGFGQYKLTTPFFHGQVW